MEEYLKGLITILLEKEGQNFCCNNLILECPESIREILLKSTGILLGLNPFTLRTLMMKSSVLTVKGMGIWLSHVTKKKYVGNAGRRGIIIRHVRK